MEQAVEIRFHGKASVAFKFGVVSHFSRWGKLDVLAMDAFVWFAANSGLAGRKASLVVLHTIIPLGAIFVP